MPETRKTLSEFLLDEKLLTPQQLQTAHMEAEKTGDPLNLVLIRMGMVPEDKIMNFYTTEHGIPRANFENLDPAVMNLIPEAITRRYHLVPLRRKEQTLTIAMTDPLNILVIDEIKFRTNLSVKATVATESEIMAAISQHSQVEGSMGEILKTIDLNTVSVGEEAEFTRLKNIAEEAPIIKLVNFVLNDAFRNRASDVHIEPDENFLRVRNRIDGVLYNLANLPKYLQAAIISRCKIMSDINIAVKRAPQDGRFEFEVEGKNIDVRVSTFPTIYGENVVMRLLDASSIMIGVDELGLSEADLNRYKDLLQSPFGIILVTGPTGSGKTTMLYSSLSFLNSPKKNIITIEDPVEYHLFGIRQSQVNPKAGMTFANGLRSILRQDPDIIMVGEIRDLETAEVSVHAALTGHLVLSTIHTNDAPSTIIRLTDMGIKPFLAASSVIGILAQRLVRTICKECKVPVKPSLESVAKLGLPIPKEGLTFYMGKGCDACKGIGFKGRTGVFEFMIVTERIRELVSGKSSIDAIRKAAMEEGMKTLRENGLQKVLAGITTLEEVIQATKTG
jgi:type IV pilus assembly protein PilB